MSLAKLEVIRGTSCDWLLRASNRTDGTSPSEGDFLETDVLSATVSMGDGYPSIFAPSVSWAANGADVTQGIFGLSVADEDTDLDPGDYLVTVFAARDGRTYAIAKARLRIKGTTGEAEAPKTYCSYEDLVDELPWIDQIKGETDITGFLRQRAQARVWMDGLILQAQPRGGVGLISYQDRWWWDFGGGGAEEGNALSHDDRLRAYLDDDCLMLTTPYGRKIVEACVYWTLAKILRRTDIQMPGVSNASLAAKYASEANFAACNSTAEIDTNADGKCDLAIPLSITNTRHA